MLGVVYKSYNINTEAALNGQSCPNIKNYDSISENAQTVQWMQRGVERKTVV